jgi:hypothetical protein
MFEDMNMTKQNQSIEKNKQRNNFKKSILDIDMLSKTICLTESFTTETITIK